MYSDQTIVGYTYRADNFHPDCLISTMVASRELSPAARDMSAENVLDQHAGANAIDRDNLWSFDSGEFPKPFTDDEARGDESCGVCGKLFILPSYDRYSEMVTREVEQVTISHGVAGQIVATVRVRSSFPDAPDHVATTTYWGSAYGAPVFMSLGKGQVRVTDPERFGSFETDPDAWVRAFNA
jgi:hypothetical protein